jgi:hypothetical protein
MSKADSAGEQSAVDACGVVDYREEGAGGGEPDDGGAKGSGVPKGRVSTYSDVDGKAKLAFCPSTISLIL